MQELIARLEKATGPSKALDRELVILVGKATEDDYTSEDWIPFTASIDAALTLVPEGLAWTLGQNVHHRYWQACVNGLDDQGAPMAVGFSGHTDLKSPALALCIAALQARAAAP